MSAALLILGLIALQRLLELAWSARNTRRLLARGAYEVGRRHYMLFPLLHGGWLLAILLAVLLSDRVNILWPAIGCYGGLQVLRLWVLWSLGERWTTRIIIVPHMPPIRSGLYRAMRHPNYAIVAGEILLLPLAFGLWPIALVASSLNAALLAHRIAIEDRALGRSTGELAS